MSTWTIKDRATRNEKITHFLLGQELSVPRATRCAHGVQLLLEPSNVVLSEGETEGKYLFRWGRAIRNETARGAVTALDDVHLALDMRAGIRKREERSKDEAGLNHLGHLGRRGYLWGASCIPVNRFI